MTKEEIYEKLDTEVKLRGLSPRTCKTYKNAIGLFLDWADKPYEDLEEIDFRNYLIYLVNRGDLSTNTINMYNASIRFLLEVILEKNINYRRTARLRKVFTLPNVWNQETIERFFSVIDDPRDRAIFLNIYGSGLRVSEIVNLKIQDIDSKSMRLHIRHAKGNKDRYTILSKRGLLALRQYWKVYRPMNVANYLFPGKSVNGNFSANSVEILFRQYKKTAGISEPGTVHTLRHSFAAHALENDVDVLCIKQLLGHSCFESTNVYLHVSKTKMYQTPSPADRLNQ